MDDDDNLYDDYDYEEGDGGGDEPSKPGGNRTFVVSLGIVAFIFLLSLIALAVVAAVILPQQRVKRENQQAVIYAQNTATAYTATQANLIAPALLHSPTPQAAAVLVQPTNTAVMAEPTSAPQALAMGGGMDSRTATVAALLTQAALSGVTAAPAATYPVVAATTLPTAGFADEIRLPLLIGIALILALTIILARRLRMSKSKR